jgi:hypothetical protein
MAAGSAKQQQTSGVDLGLAAKQPVATITQRHP